MLVGLLKSRSRSCLCFVTTFPDCTTYQLSRNLSVLMIGHQFSKLNGLLGLVYRPIDQCDGGVRGHDCSNDELM